MLNRVVMGVFASTGKVSDSGIGFLSQVLRQINELRFLSGANLHLHENVD